LANISAGKGRSRRISFNDEAVRQAVEWLSSTDLEVDDSAWLQVLCDGSAFFSKEIGHL
jgi:hypothetical protein